MLPEKITCLDNTTVQPGLSLFVKPSVYYSFSRTHTIDKNGNIGITGFTTLKQNKTFQQQNITPLSIELTTSAIQVLSEPLRQVLY